jgi:hypothetical protein
MGDRSHTQCFITAIAAREDGDDFRTYQIRFPRRDGGVDDHVYGKIIEAQSRPKKLAGKREDER